MQGDIDNPVFTASGDSGTRHASISTSTTTQVLTGEGVLVRVVVAKKGTTASDVVIYDNTASTGTPIVTIDSLSSGGTYEFGIPVTTGIRVVTTGAPNIVVVYR